MASGRFHASASSSDTSDYAPDDIANSDDSLSDPGAGPSTSRPIKEEPLEMLPVGSASVTEGIKDAWDHEPLSGQYDHVADVATRLLGCGWQGCRSKLASFALLEKHLRRKHIEASEAAPAATTSRGAKKFVCRYGSCANRWFATRNDLMVHVLDHHLEHVRLTCPITACRRVYNARSTFRRHLYTAHAKDPRFDALLKSSILQASSPTFSSAPIILTPISVDVVPPLPPTSSKFPTYLPFLPPLRPAPLNPKRNKVADRTTDLDPWFMEFFQEEETLKPKHRLQLGRQPLQTPRNLDRVKQLETVQLTPSRRLRRTESLTSTAEPSPETEQSLAVEVKVQPRIKGTVLYLPPRAAPPPPDLSKVSWREFGAPHAPELEVAATDAALSSRAQSVSTLAMPASSRASSEAAPIRESSRQRKLSSPPGSPSDIQSASLLPATTLAELAEETQASSQSITAPDPPVPIPEPSLPPTIGFQALSAWRRGFEHAVENGVMRKDQDPFMSKPIRKAKGAKKRGRAPKR